MDGFLLSALAAKLRQSSNRVPENFNFDERAQAALKELTPTELEAFLFAIVRHVRCGKGPPGVPLSAKYINDGAEYISSSFVALRELSPEVAMEARIIASRKFFHLRGNLLMDAQKITALRRLEPAQAVTALRALCERLDDPRQPPIENLSALCRAFFGGVAPPPAPLQAAPRRDPGPSPTLRGLAAPGGPSFPPGAPLPPSLLAPPSRSNGSWSSGNTDSLGVPSPDRSRSVSPDPRSLAQPAPQRALEALLGGALPATGFGGLGPAAPDLPDDELLGDDPTGARPASASSDPARGAALRRRHIRAMLPGELQQLAATIERTLRFVPAGGRVAFTDEVLQLVADAGADNGRVMLESIGEALKGGVITGPRSLFNYARALHFRAKHSGGMEGGVRRRVLRIEIESASRADLTQTPAAAAAAAAATAAGSPHDGVLFLDPRVLRDLASLPLAAAHAALDAFVDHVAAAGGPRGVADHCDLLARCLRPHLPDPDGPGRAERDGRGGEKGGEGGGTLAPEVLECIAARLQRATAQAAAAAAAAPADDGAGPALAAVPPLLALLTDPAALRCVQCAGAKDGAELVDAAAAWAEGTAGRPGAASGLEYLRALRDRAAQSRRVEGAARRRLLRLELELLARLPPTAPAPRPLRFPAEGLARLSGLPREEATAAVELALEYLAQQQPRGGEEGPPASPGACPEAAALDRALDAVGAPPLASGAGGIAGLFTGATPASLGGGGTPTYGGTPTHGGSPAPSGSPSPARTPRGARTPHRGSPVPGLGGADSSEEPAPFAEERRRRGPEEGEAAAAVAVAQLRREMAALAGVNEQLQEEVRVLRRQLGALRVGGSQVAHLEEENRLLRERVDDLRAALAAALGGHGGGVNRRGSPGPPGPALAGPPIEVKDEDFALDVERLAAGLAARPPLFRAPQPPGPSNPFALAAAAAAAAMSGGPGGLGATALGGLGQYTAFSAPPSPLAGPYDDVGGPLDPQAAAAAAAYGAAWGARGRSPDGPFPEGLGGGPAGPGGFTPPLASSPSRWGALGGGAGAGGAALPPSLFFVGSGSSPWGASPASTRSPSPGSGGAGMGSSAVQHAGDPWQHAQAPGRRTASGAGAPLLTTTPPAP